MKELLKNGLTCCVTKGGREIFSSKKKGIAPLISLIENQYDMTGCVVYDKTVGKAAALLHVFMGVKEVHACVMSNRAVEIFNRVGVKAYYENLVENILNRKGDGVCSLEKVVEDIEGPAIAYEALKSKVKSIRSPLAVQTPSD